MTFKKRNILKFVAVFCFLAMFVQCTTNPSQNLKIKVDSEDYFASKNYNFNAFYLTQIDSFEKSLNHLEQQVNLGNKESSETAFNNAFIAFKSFGFILDFLDYSLYEILNGAPVFKEDVSSPGANVIDPMGLQIIYELISNPIENQKQIQQQIVFLKTQLKYIRTALESIDLTSKDLYNAVAQNLVRFETRTLTGFENPDLKNEFEFLSAELDAMNVYLSFTTNSTLQINYDSTLVLDKLHFIKHNLYPFKEELFPFVDSVNGISPVKNYAANVYNSDFLNSTFYSSNGIQNQPNLSKIKLGKMLFSDPILSNNSINFTCATCHQPNNFFTDGLGLSISNKDEIKLKRNTPTLIHAAFQSKYMYDGRAESLEEQMLHVFKNKNEFQTSMIEAISKLNNDESYLEMFQINYPELSSSPITLYSITDALANYVRSLNGSQSTFDKYMRNEIKSISPSIAKGFNLFNGKAKCGTCHFAPTFSGLIAPMFQDSEFENIGIPKLIDDDVWTMDDDLGRYNFYPNNEFKHFFKTSTIRNVEHTAPYMHNGSLGTLEAVMDFYNEGGGVTHGLNYQNQTLPTENLNLSTQEINDVITFMKSLSDERYLVY